MVNVTVSLVGCQQDILLDMDILLNQNIWPFGNYFVISKVFFKISWDYFAAVQWTNEIQGCFNFSTWRLGNLHLKLKSSEGTDCTINSCGKRVIDIKLKGGNRVIDNFDISTKCLKRRKKSHWNWVQNKVLKRRKKSLWNSEMSLSKGGN